VSLRLPLDIKNCRTLNGVFIAINYFVFLTMPYRQTIKLFHLAVLARDSPTSFQAPGMSFNLP
jgi:hypothetical protein